MEYVRAAAPEHFRLVIDAGVFGPPMNHSAIAANLRAALARDDLEATVSIFPGRAETVRVVEFVRRPVVSTR